MKLKIETNNQCLTSVSALDGPSWANLGGLNSKGKIMMNIQKGATTPLDVLNRT